MVNRNGARLGVDIGGTFTDVALEAGGETHTTKTLTTQDAPERGVLAAIRDVLAKASRAPGEVAVIIYGTTLATNLLIERKGARTALITTEGFRDSIEMRNENRFEQYDVNIDLPAPLVPRYLRFPVPERVSARGEVLVPLDEGAIDRLVPVLEREEVESVAVGFLHSYVHPAHETRAGELIARRLPGVSISLSSEVSPEMREYERFSTACANAYCQPMMSRHLTGLERELRDAGFVCPVYMMLSGGGITTLETAVRFPVRLVESGPAGGAIFSSRLAGECDLDRVLSYDMGGTTAKICLIDDGRPQTARSFEVARVYRFLKGSGLPLRIPVIEMVEIGAGGGSIASVDAMGRISVGPESAGSDPGPACYDLGGGAPAVTDADLVLGKIDPDNFAGGSMRLDPAKAEGALARAVGAPLDLELHLAALGVAEMVDENMANAARVHAIESGKNVATRTLVAFGGAAPLHAARMAEKLGIDAVVVPSGAGVGSAIGFLRAPVAYEVVRSHHQRLGALDVAAVNALIEQMRVEARGVVEPGAMGQALVEQRVAYMRYVGQGHEVMVPVPAEMLGADAETLLRAAFEQSYRELYDRLIPNLEIEILTWALLLGTAPEKPKTLGPAEVTYTAEPACERQVFDQASGAHETLAVYRRADLEPGAQVPGPALIVEDDTSTLVSGAFDARVNALGYIVLNRKRAREEA
ncbi:MAG: hydantoinase/oxoprolinase family protein [Alphaproteobacteria bacterium]